MSYNSATPPLCRWCGKPIAKHTESVYVVQPGKDDRVLGKSVTGPLYSKSDCQRTVNTEVVSLSYWQETDWDGNPKGERYVHRFSTWDRESYVDPFFCNGNHALLFGCMMAREGYCTKAYNEALRRSQEGTP